MGLFDGLANALFGGGGGGSSSTTSSATTTNATDKRVVADGGALVIGEGSTTTVNASDLGAVQKAADLGQAAILGATQVATATNAQAQATLVKALDVTGNAVAQLEKAYSSASDAASGNRSFLAAGAVVAALLLAMNMGKKRA